MRRPVRLDRPGQLYRHRPRAPAVQATSGWCADIEIKFSRQVSETKFPNTGVGFGWSFLFQNFDWSAVNHRVRRFHDGLLEGWVYEGG